MQTRQYRLAHHPAAWGAVPAGELHDAQLVLAFGPSPCDAMPGADWFAALADRWPHAARVYCSSAGHIADTEVVDGDVVVTAVRFAHTRTHAAAVALPDGDYGERAGAELAAALPADGLQHVLLFAEGLRVNGQALLRGFNGALPAGAVVTGGLAGDDERLRAAAVALGGAPAGDVAVAVGLYGDRLSVGTAALGGWERFGPDRVVTRAEQGVIGTVVYELDGEPALALYKRYLGPLAEELPASALLFPLALRTRDDDVGVVRTVLGVDEATGGVHLAGDVAEGIYVRLMKASTDRLIDAAAEAAGAADAQRGGGADDAALALIVSCAGRRWMMRQRTEEELEAVRDALGGGVRLAGFYSYGEIAPVGPHRPCELHNQTMTITTFRER